MVVNMGDADRLDVQRLSLTHDSFPTYVQACNHFESSDVPLML
jgi:hypothetical protein